MLQTNRSEYMKRWQRRCAKPQSMGIRTAVILPTSAIHKYCKAKPFPSLTFDGVLKQIIRESLACCSGAHDVDMQRSNSQTRAVMHQNHTGNQGDSRTSENKKVDPWHAREGDFIPDHVRLDLRLPYPRRIHAEPQTHGLLDHGLIAYSRGRGRRPHR